MAKSLSGFAYQDGARAHSLAILQAIFGSNYLRLFDVRLWDGGIEPARGPKRFTIVLKAPWTLRKVFSPPVSLNGARALAAGAIDFEGDVEAAVDAVRTALEGLRPATLLPVLRDAFALPAPPKLAPLDGEARLRGRRHSIARDRAAIAHHYNQPVEFFKTFLDENLVYSCAYYNEDVVDDSLEAAQIAKIDHILRKLRIRPGQRLLDLGCGYGALAIRAAERYGAHVLGVTLSSAQKQEADRRIAERGVGDRVRVELRDYRELGDERFDAVVSVGMVEHVGRKHLRTYLRHAYDLVRPGGSFLNHGIAAQSPEGRMRKRETLIERYVFPDGEVWPVGAFLEQAEAIGFEIRDVENLREHYARTLRRWLANLEEHRAGASAIAGEAAYRIWRTYIAGSAAAFARGDLGLFQVLFVKPYADGLVDLPATRRDLYR
ncbi:MAG: class I SAM-dependent methyltransferase [Candidatus Eremiobacteraeota bacterium]|nr:class I SAM-dependent methyltransferase [Candidatus Eremiobacteraeota bacterium]MBC5803416.1 class I SAM-dependent methyltransferase [Candidatus Eremiobacteraeota bacterium]MBC5820376.1 class I SAM-dependent methyltransferase [Candidatus Eremiobacteraeota bacterium]